jgi:hypothetical protein
VQVSFEVAEVVISRRYICWRIGVAEGGWLLAHSRACEIHLEMGDPLLEMLLRYVLAPSHGVALVDDLSAKEMSRRLEKYFWYLQKVISKMSRRMQISEYKRSLD